MQLIKSHAFGNDFLLVDEREVVAVADIPALARAVCERHRGIGADGLLIFGDAGGGTTMRLLNADGSASEISGNGLRCLAAWLARRDGGRDIEVTTGAGLKRLQLLDRAGSRYTFRAAMGQPEELTQEEIALGGATVRAITLRVGNPQCVVLGDVTIERLHTLASALAVHPRFPAGTNVELAAVERPDRVRILIWERGVGPTEASGTGACAAAVAAMAYGGAARTVDVISPGGRQRVEWRDDGLYLTGWAELVGEVRWLLN
jgi:diaminopimelate epimerase